MDTPLHYATYCPSSPGSPDVVKCLLTCRASVNAKNKNADSPLMNAALHNNVDAAKVLLEHRADMNQSNSSERTAKDFASVAGCTEVLNLLEQQQVFCGGAVA